ncbi:MAG: hypothetical protein ACK4XY_01895 [Chloroherpetonaceae bacterium]
MTEQEKNKIRPLSKHEEDILEALHFMLSFDDLLQETNINEQILDKSLRALMRDELVQALKWNSEKNDFIALDTIPDELRGLHFLATKHGLFSYHTS